MLVSIKKKIYVRIQRLANVCRIIACALQGHELIAIENHSKRQSFKKFDAVDTLRERIQKTLEKEFTILNLGADISVADICNNLAANLLEAETRSPLRKITDLAQDTFAESWRLVIVSSGTATWWEYNLRGAAERMGIETRVKGASKKSKQRKMKSPGFRKIEDVIKDLRRKVPHFAIDLERQLVLRGALVHANFRELKELFRNGPKSRGSKLIAVGFPRFVPGDFLVLCHS